MTRAPAPVALLATLGLCCACDADVLTVFAARGQQEAPAAGGAAGSGGAAGVVILDRVGGSSVPDNVADLFAGEAEGVGPCLVEPELGALLPRDWLRPRFRFIPALGQSLFEIRLRSSPDYDVVVYTSSTSWTLPAAHWAELVQTDVERAVTISVRGLDPARVPVKPSLATSGSISIAPVGAGGEIHYFTSTGATALKTFAIAEEAARETLRPDQTAGRCVGCHAATPDQAFIASSVSSDPVGGDPAHLELRARDGSGSEPVYLSSDARTLLAREQQHLPTFSAAHFHAGDRILISILNGQLIWTDLEATSQLENSAWGTLQRSGDPNASVTHPELNHAGSAVAYTSIGMPSTIAVADQTDLYLVPYAARLGGQAQPLAGASSADANEYYPAFSADDAFVAFNKTTPPAVPADPTFPFAGATSTYANPLSELYVVAAPGGVPQRLAANDPPACSGRVSPGVSNSWAKWSPRVAEVAGKRYYFLAFSSTRADPALNQLYATALVVGEDGQLTSYPALYFWNQPAAESNHQPVWSEPSSSSQ
jgi:hypothetical protein